MRSTPTIRWRGAIAAQAQGDLLVLVRTINEKTGKLRQDIQVDDVRRTVTFFGSTAGEGGWRIAIVDSVDELNDAGANALLKVLEEPPQRALLLLVSHSSARVLPTIRSRCRLLSLAAARGRRCRARGGGGARAGAPKMPDIQAAAAVADGSVARALALLDGDALELRNRILGTARSPAGGRSARAARAGRCTLWRRRGAARGLPRHRQCLALGPPARADRRSRRGSSGWREAWEQVNSAARDVEEYNLERKPLVFSVFGWLAEAARA